MKMFLKSIFMAVASLFQAQQPSDRPGLPNFLKKSAVPREEASDTKPSTPLINTEKKPLTQTSDRDKTRFEKLSAELEDLKKQLAPVEPTTDPVSQAAGKKVSPAIGGVSRKDLKEMNSKLEAITKNPRGKVAIQLLEKPIHRNITEVVQKAEKRDAKKPTLKKSGKFSQEKLTENSIPRAQTGRKIRFAEKVQEIKRFVGEKDRVEEKGLQPIGKDTRGFNTRLDPETLDYYKLLNYSLDKSAEQNRIKMLAAGELKEDTQQEKKYSRSDLINFFDLDHAEKAEKLSRSQWSKDLRKEKEKNQSKFSGEAVLDALRRTGQNHMSEASLRAFYFPENKSFIEKVKGLSSNAMKKVQGAACALGTKAEAILSGVKEFFIRKVKPSQALPAEVKSLKTFRIEGTNPK